MAVNILPTTERVVCNSALKLALNQAEGRQMTIRHSRSLKGRVEEARHKFGLVAERVEKFQDALHSLVREQLTTADVQGYFERLFPLPVATPSVTNGAC